MKCVVTGAAGFIGSHLCEKLLASGHEVTGIDAFIPYYPMAVKYQNLALALTHPRFTFHQLDLRHDTLEGALEDAEVIFHLAAMPGLNQSWIDFELYWTCNVLATQRLLEAIRRRARRLHRLICASTSSVYGRFASGDESLTPRPVSPYGVTKLAGENLCRAFADVYGLPLVILRYFSIYGPRQRPDMGYYRFIRSILRDDPIVVTGDGHQVRGNTYVTDCVEATFAAVQAAPGEIYNIGGNEAATVWDILRKLEELAGRSFLVKQEPARPGDQRYTFADTSKITAHLGWRPKINLDDGLARQWLWQKQELETPCEEPVVPIP